MAQEDAIGKLRALLDQKVFTPTPGRSYEDSPPEDRKEESQTIQESMKSEQHRFHGQDKAEAVRENYYNDRPSDRGWRVSPQGRKIFRPCQDVRDEFRALCKELGVR